MQEEVDKHVEFMIQKEVVIKPSIVLIRGPVEEKQMASPSFISNTEHWKKDNS